MKPSTKFVIAFSTLALAAGGALAQTTTTPKSDTGASTAQPSTAPAPITPKAETPSVQEKNPGANPKEGASPNAKEGSSSSTTAQGPATTRAPASGGKVTFESLDVNNDGKVSKTEAEAHPDLAKEFSKLDKNKDGMLDQTEFRAHKSK